MTDIEILNRWTEKPIELPDDCPRSSVRVVLEWCARRRHEGQPSANLDGANLDRANLSRANLDGANLDGANLYGANLNGAKGLCGARWGAPSALLLASWSHLPDALILESIVHDMANHDDLDAFRRWVSLDRCPYTGEGYAQVVGGMGSGRHREILKIYGVDRAIRRAKHGGAWHARKLMVAILDWAGEQEPTR